MAEQRRSLAGRVAVVTGGSRGIGRAVALELGARGARVAVVARTAVARDDLPGTVHDTVATLHGMGAAALAVVIDLSRPGAPARVVHEVTAALGPVDVLINNAANTGAAAFETLEATSPDSWRHSLELNLSVPWELTRLVRDGMAGRGEGLVVNLSSGAAAASGDDTQAFGLGAAYGTTKAALDQLTRLLGRELLPSGIVVTSFDPGFTRTEATELYAASFDVDLSLARPMADVARTVADLCEHPHRELFAARVVTADDVAAAGALT